MSTTGLFAGAKVSLGGVNVTGKSLLEDYKPVEAAYIVGRYMQTHAEGNLFKGSASSVIYKLWPESFSDYTEVTTSKMAKKIYWALKRMGFRPINEGEFRGWKLPFDLEKSYKDFQAGVIREVPPSDVQYRCVCGAGPFKAHDEFVAHRDKNHAKGDKVDVIEMVTCSVCANDVPSNALSAHIASVHGSKICPKCGKVVTIKGLGGHMHGHKPSREGKELLDALKQYPGLQPREYGELLGLNSSAISSRFGNLKKLDLAYVVGNRQAARYYPGKKPKGGRKHAPAPAPQPQLPFKAEKEKKAPEPVKVEQNGSLLIPGAQEVTIIETKDGTTLMFKDGIIYAIGSLTKLGNV